ncbi:UNVERIFIED_CONTAM: hypothetical protein OHV15_03510 [Microbacterium sp. SLM126]
MTSPSAHRIGPLGIVFLSAVLVQTGILVAFLVGALLLSGAQVTAEGNANWEQVVPFPVFPVPAWLLTALASVALLAGIVWALTSRPADASALTGAIGPAVAGAFASGFFLFAFGEAGALATEYLLPLGISAAAVLVVFVGSVVQGARAGRAERMPQAGS